MNSLGLYQVVYSPTWADHLLNMLATDACDAVTEVHVDDAGCISDHRLILAKVKFSRPARRTITPTYRNIRKINLAVFQSALFQYSLFSSPAGIADDFADQMAEVVTSELDTVTPSRSANVDQLSQYQSGSQLRLLLPNENTDVWIDGGRPQEGNTIASFLY